MLNLYITFIGLSLISVCYVYMYRMFERVGQKIDPYKVSKRTIPPPRHLSKSVRLDEQGNVEYLKKNKDVKGWKTFLAKKEKGTWTKLIKKDMGRFEEAILIAEKDYARKRRGFAFLTLALIFIYVVGVGSIHFWMQDWVPIMIDTIIIVGGWFWANHYTGLMSTFILFIFVAGSFQFATPTANMYGGLLLGYPSKGVSARVTGLPPDLDSLGVVVTTGTKVKLHDNQDYSEGIFYAETDGKATSVYIPATSENMREIKGQFKGELLLRADLGGSYAIYVGRVIENG